MSPGTGDSAYGTLVDSAKRKPASPLEQLLRRIPPQRRRVRSRGSARDFRVSSSGVVLAAYLLIKCSVAHRRFCSSFDKNSTHNSPTAQNRSDHGNANGSVTSTE